jgi:hypothetical protein
VIGQDLERLAVIGNNTRTDLLYALTNLLCRHDPQITARKLLDQHGGIFGLCLLTLPAPGATLRP